MYSHLLKKALPFTLTLVVGTALGGQPVGMHGLAECVFRPDDEGSFHLK